MRMRISRWLTGVAPAVLLIGVGLVNSSMSSAQGLRVIPMGPASDKPPAESFSDPRPMPIELAPLPSAPPPAAQPVTAPSTPAAPSQSSADRAASVSPAAAAGAAVKPAHAPAKGTAAPAKAPVPIKPGAVVAPPQSAPAVVAPPLPAYEPVAAPSLAPVSAPGAVWLMARPDEYLSDVLLRWGRETGWRVEWRSPREFRVRSEFSCEQGFSLCIEDFLSTLRRGASPLNFVKDDQKKVVILWVGGAGAPGSPYSTFRQ